MCLHLCIAPCLSTPVYSPVSVYICICCPMSVYTCIHLLPNIRLHLYRLPNVRLHMHFAQSPSSVVYYAVSVCTCILPGSVRLHLYITQFYPMCVYTCTLPSVRLHMYIIIAHLSIYTCILPNVCLHLYITRCPSTPVQCPMSVYTCI